MTLERTDHALDNMRDSLNSVASGIDQWLHAGWRHSHLTGRRHRHSADSSHSGTKTSVAIWIPAGEGEIFDKGVISKVEKLSEFYDAFSRKGLAINHVTN